MVSTWGDNNRMLTRSLETNEDQSSSTKTIEFDGRGKILSVAFLVDGKHIASSGVEGKIRRWRVEDGTEAGTPMDAGDLVCNFAVSRDGKWIVSEVWQSVQVWNADDGKKVTEFRGHHGSIYAVDVSPDSTKFASGSYDDTACVWSLPTGQRLLGPWKHDDAVFAVKFSPNGRFIATATSLFPFTTVETATLFSISQPESHSQTITPSLGRATANNSLLYLLARSSVSTPPLVQRFLNGPFTATNPTALHWQATAHSSQPLPGHQSRSGMLRHTSKSDLSSNMQTKSDAWPSRQTTTLRLAVATKSHFAVSVTSSPFPTVTT